MHFTTSNYTFVQDKDQIILLRYKYYICYCYLNIWKRIVLKLKWGKYHITSNQFSYPIFLLKSALKLSKI